MEFTRKDEVQLKDIKSSESFFFKETTKGLHTSRLCMKLSLRAVVSAKHLALTTNAGSAIASADCCFSDSNNDIFKNDIFIVCFDDGHVAKVPSNSVINPVKARIIIE